METRPAYSRITFRIGGGTVELRCEQCQASCGDRLEGRLQLFAGSKPLRVETARVGLHPASWAGQRDWGRGEPVQWDQFTVPRQRSKQLPFAVSAWRGLPFGTSTWLATQVKLVGQEPEETGLWITILPPSDLTALTAVLQGAAGLPAPEWSNAVATYDVIADFTPGESLRERVEEISLRLLRERAAISGELHINERERTTTDYLKAARGKDRRVLPFRWALGDLESAQLFFANAFRAYSNAPGDLPIPSRSVSSQPLQLPFPATSSGQCSISDFRHSPITPGIEIYDAGGAIIPGLDPSAEIG